jgi:ABC-type Mn2+/Zn2+ transport system ATPase subunit
MSMLCVCHGCRQLIVQLGLYPVWYKKLSWLSTGEIRKVLLAFVLSKSPKVLVLDKPYDGLDGPSRSNLKAILSQLCLVR